MRQKVWLLFAALIAADLAACGQRAAEKPQPSPGPSKALVIGLIPEGNIFKQLERYEPLADYLARQVDAKVTLRILPRYGNIIANFNSAGLDGAFFGSFTYALAHEKLGVKVLARPVWLSGGSTYCGCIIVRKDSGIRSAQDMRGKRFAFVDKATTAGYLLPLDYFIHNGIREHKSYFKETYFAGTHEDVIFDVLRGRADVGAAKNTVFDRIAASDPRVANELAILERSPDVPENGLALRPNIDDALAQRIKSALLSMDETPEGRVVLQKFGAIEFIETTHEDYTPVYRYAREIGLDLGTYDYLND